MYRAGISPHVFVEVLERCVEIVRHGHEPARAPKLRAVLRLAAAPRQAVPFLNDRLKPAAPIDPQKLGRWIADLESDRFAVRQEASANLVKAGEQAVPALRKVLTSQPTIETRLRVEGLLDKLTGGTLTAEQLRLVRAAEALEKMGTPEARELLRTLAGGAPGHLLDLGTDPVGIHPIPPLVAMDVRVAAVGRDRLGVLGPRAMELQPLRDERTEVGIDAHGAGSVPATEPQM